MGQLGFHPPFLGNHQLICSLSPLFTRVLAPSQVVGNGISEPSTVSLSFTNPEVLDLPQFRNLSCPTFAADFDFPTSRPPSRAFRRRPVGR